MRKAIVVFFTILTFGLTVATTVHSLSDFQEHFLHLTLLAGLSIFFVSYVLKDTIRIRNRFALVALLLLFAFSSIRVFSCHLLSSNPQDITHTNVINHPCFSATTGATAEISIAPIIENVKSLEQKPFIAQLSQFINQFSNKSPPQLAA